MGDTIQPIYVDLASESDDPQVTEIDSLCLTCHEMGKTRLLMTKIPHYKEVILSSFSCDHCGNHNTSIQPGQYQELGVCYHFTVREEKDLSRQIVRSNCATVSVPEVELEIPADSEKGEITTVEGILRRTIEGLSQDQSDRRLYHPEIAEQIEEFISKIEELLDCKTDFTVVVDDPSGNTFIENPIAPQQDPYLIRKTYKRTKEQNALLGLNFEEPEEQEVVEKQDEDNEDEDETSVKDEVLIFDTICNHCSKPTKTNMKVTQIPYFKEVVIMATNCEGCGHRTNEVKSGGGISEKGKRITLKLTDPCDMARDVLKSETCEIEVPELGLHLGGGLIGGKFTTLEGLLIDIRNDLENNPFLTGDSSDNSRKAIIQKLIADLEQVRNGNLQVTIKMNDPAGNSYLQNLYAPDDDPEMEVEEYERSYEENEALGINDMKTENYEEESIDPGSSSLICS
ncbi:zinc finger protein ZPR1 [Macrobrachium rosenbergii]|uniref:zinc finger protein ZPR1 n=1 Tax=Macrobrachium rosenbergii TaxID=79674 RepID=UPI0034D7A2EE